MDFEGRLWREASIAADLDEFLDHVGAALLTELGVDTLVVRALGAGAGWLETMAWLRRGVVGVVHPARPRTELREPAVVRLRAWIDAGELACADVSDAPPFSRDLLRGVGDVVDASDRAWWLVPLHAHGVGLGVLLAQAPIAAPPARRRLAFIGEVVATVLASAQARRELERLRTAADAERAAALARLQLRDIGPALIGADTGLRAVMRQVEQLASSRAPVLVVSEPGSGKEVVARTLHEQSPRAAGPLLRVHCGAIPPALLEVELFGQERSAGGLAPRPGYLERADGGTLLLDELVELPRPAQRRLLRLLVDGVIERVGGARPRPIDVRLVVATQRDLAPEVARGAFDAELWARLSAAPIQLPPLRARAADIPALAAQFADRAARRFGMPPLRLGPAELALLRGYDWPGNVRELAAVMERATILGEGRSLEVARALGVAPTAASGAFPTFAEAQRAHLERALAACKGRIDGARGAARLLAMHPNTLRSKLAKLGVDPARFRPAEDA